MLQWVRFLQGDQARGLGRVQGRAGSTGGWCRGHTCSVSGLHSSSKATLESEHQSPKDTKV